MTLTILGTCEPRNDSVLVVFAQQALESAPGRIRFCQVVRLCGKDSSFQDHNEEGSKWIYGIRLSITWWWLGTTSVKMELFTMCTPSPELKLLRPATTLAIRSRVRMRFHVLTRSKVRPIYKWPLIRLELWVCWMSVQAEECFCHG